MISTALNPSAPPRGADPALARLAQWRGAFPALDGLIASGTAPGPALRRLGLSLWSAGQPAAAAEALAEACGWTPDDPALRLDLGFALRASGAAAPAAEAFQRATELKPEDARAWLALGLTLRELRSPRAEAALERALALDAGLTEAAYALGLVAFDARRYAEAARHWRGVVASGFRAPGLMLGLGQCQFFLGEFGAAAQSLRAHLEAAPGDEAIARRLALVAFLDAAIRSGPEAGLAAYRAEVGAGAALAEPIAKTAVQLLSAYGYVPTALAVARAFPAASDDPIHRHHLAALAGEALTRAPAEYVASYFDGFADSFDTQMVEVLQYRGPDKLARLLSQTGAKGGDTLDLGCGTGAAAALLRRRATRLAGVDLSAKMLEKAAARGVYDELARADMVEHLQERRAAYDLIFAADSLIYLGDLEPLVAAAARALKVGGVFAASLEIGDAPYTLLSSGRFAHAPRHFIAAGAAHGLGLRASRRAFLRLEAHRRVSAALILLERRA